MTLSQAIRAAGDLRPFARPCHAIPSYYNGHIKDWHQRTRMAMLSLEDIEAEDWELLPAEIEALDSWQVAQALKVVCPRCDASPGIRCINLKSGEYSIIHPMRFNASFGV